MLKVRTAETSSSERQRRLSRITMARLLRLRDKPESQSSTSSLKPLNFRSVLRTMMLRRIHVSMHHLFSHSYQRPTRRSSSSPMLLIRLVAKLLRSTSSHSRTLLQPSIRRNQHQSKDGLRSMIPFFAQSHRSRTSLRSLVQPLLRSADNHYHSNQLMISPRSSTK